MLIWAAKRFLMLNFNFYVDVESSSWLLKTECRILELFYLNFSASKMLREDLLLIHLKLTINGWQMGKVMREKTPWREPHFYHEKCNYQKENLTEIKVTLILKKGDFRWKTYEKRAILCALLPKWWKQMNPPFIHLLIYIRERFLIPIFK